MFAEQKKVQECWIMRLESSLTLSWVTITQALSLFGKQFEQLTENNVAENNEETRSTNDIFYLTPAFLKVIQ